MTAIHQESINLVCAFHEETITVVHLERGTISTPRLVLLRLLLLDLGDVDKLMQSKPSQSKNNQRHHPGQRAALWDSFDDVVATCLHCC